jgi:phosphatidylinositol 4-kinase A
VSHSHSPGNISSQRSPQELSSEVIASLKDLEVRSQKGHIIELHELREFLRKAAAVLCASESDNHSLIHYLVSIPFAVFTKQSIRLGISLWMGVINENPIMESRIMVEIAKNWENTARKRVGLFNNNNM